MTRNELIGAVALDFIKALVEQEPEGTLRYCMLGLEGSLVRSIAKAVFADKEASATVAVKISSIFDATSELPEEARSDQSITHWRHCQLPEGKRAVLFAASQEELQRNDKSVEKITKIETDTLRARYDAWIDKAGLTATHLDQTKRSHLRAALESANSTHTARTIETFADFVLAISNGVTSKGLPLQKAIDDALPSLRLPRYAGYFDRIPDKKRDTPTEWNKVFRRLLSKVRPLLVRETDRGDPIPYELLRGNLKELQDRLTDSEYSVIEDFIDADLRLDDWSESQKEFVKLDWRSVSDLFEGVTKRTSQTLGEQTIKFFDDEFDDQLEDDERELLASTFPKEPSDDLQEFFESYREHLARDKKLSSAWERYIYRNPKTYDDFLIGLIETIDGLRRRTVDDEISESKLLIRIPNGREKSFWRGKNPRIARYFAYRYRGLSTLLGEDVTLDFGKLEEFYFPQADDDLAKITSGSKDARSIKFEVTLDPDGAKSKLIFHWEMPVDAIGGSLPDDLQNVANHNGEKALLPTADIARQTVSAKGSIQRVALDDVNTIRDVTNTNDGSLVAPNQESGDRSGPFLSALESLSKVIGPEGTVEIRGKFDAFLASYTDAIRAWSSTDGEGIASDAFIEQANAFSELLRCLLDQANYDLAREKIWQEILRFGVANIGAGAPAAIITPWHPLRLTEISVKARQAADLVREVLAANEDDISGADLLFGQVKRELQSNFYPEVCIGFEDDQPILLAAADTAYDYTLAEPPLRRNRTDADDAQDIDPGVAARAFGAVGEQYLKLLPHERNNFSVVLYNAESKALPGALASELSSKVQQENELQCDLLLTHSEPSSIRRIYEQQNATVGDEAGSIMGSDTARDFLSRMRVGFLDTTALPSDEADRAADLVALQDVVARNAKLVWKKAPGERNPDLAHHVPPRWSRRRPIGVADTATAVYLASPSQPRVGQNYLNAIQWFLDGDNSLSEDVVPAREVNFRDGSIGDVFSQTHRIGEWVVNFDQLVDRRLLTNNGVSVIRHIHDRFIDRNIIVSTTSKPRLLRALLRERLDRVDPAIRGGEDHVIDKLIEQANAISGQVVMRAARYGHYAHELLGIVLSMEKIRSGLGGADLPLGWYFLDDFASWFGQSEEQIADIMAIAPRMEDGKPVLKVVISEAKYVGSSGHRSQAKKSAKQLEETAARIGRALDPEHKRIDRSIWLHRLGDFMIEGMKPFDDPAQLNGWDLHRWSDEVRQDKVPIQLVGFSHVFVHDDDEYVDAGAATPLKGMPHCLQQTFDKPRVAEALRRFASNAGVADVSSSSDGSDWAEALVSSQTDRQVTPDSGDGNEQPAEEAEVGSNDNTGSDESRPDSASGQKDKDDQETEGDQKRGESETSTDDGGSGDTPEDEVPGVAEECRDSWPSLDLATWVSAGRISGEDDDEAKEWLDTTVKSLQRALRGYDMTAELVGARLTPNAALVRFRGSDDLTVPKVDKRRQELLTSHAINVINVLAAPMEVVIMVARPSRTILRLRDLWRQRELPPSAPESNTSLLLGACEADGELLYLNVGDGFAGLQPHGPHSLIAGETGSGKGVLVQCLLLDICATNSPSSARIQMIDPKAGIDFPWLRQMPHLDGDLITDRDAAIETLEALVAEMERRNRLLAEAGVTKISNYNRKVDASERLPRIWLFHDELADWMMIKEYREEVELNANRLGVKARAAGINLVLVTQRPDKDALPMQLRANLTNRLVLKVADKRNSELVLDEGGAERLLGRGHLAAKLSGEGKIILAQVPFIDEDEIVEVAGLIERAWRS